MLGLLQLPAHIHQVIFSLAHTQFNLFDLRSEIDIFGAFTIDTLLNFAVFLDVPLFKLFQVGQFANERIQLRLQSCNLTLAISRSLLK